MNKPITRILLVVAVPFLSFEAFSLIQYGRLSGISFLAFLGTIIGPGMAFEFPYSTTFKIGYGIALATSLGLIISGLKWRKKVLGQIMAVIGIAGWVMCGLLGLGTGT